ncbi:xanthine dehydrogenase [Anabrus simplex]|uniref:xanthine dehydrogenase n=1 Tax=Anabrus simplex TaxID=316456 RepID=UPI0035A3680F
MSVQKLKRLKKELVFSINGKKYSVDEDVPVDTSLNTYIRNYANLRGTKAMCHEGGCGACIVNVTWKHPATGETISHAVNSCMVSVYSCNGWAITTVEGIGNKMDGYDRVQTRLMQFNGTQCGYCTPGMVMNMYSLLQGKEPVMKTVENSFGGNICRCTGYRPILDAFKSLSKDATPELKRKCIDIEELTSTKICSKNGLPCERKCKEHNSVQCNGIDNVLDTSSDPSIYRQLQGAEWYTLSTIEEVLDILKNIGDEPYMLVAGNTAQGVYRRTVEPKHFININEVKELKTHSIGSNLVLGGNMSLTETMELFYKISVEQPDKYGYTSVLADHIDLIANVPVRNTGTIAGNLSIKHQYHEFPSDMFLMLETVGATINIVETSGKATDMYLCDYLKFDMKHKIIKSVTLPPLDSSHHLRTYKIMPRAQNAHAYVNAGFLFKLDPKMEGEIIGRPNILFGGINPNFLHAVNTENALTGKSLFHEDMLKTALKSLDGELKPDHVLPDASPEYRKGLAKALFYKYFLSLASHKAKERNRSGGTMLVRPVSSGKQDYQTDKTEWPLNQPIPKVEALVQCSGEAKYVNDTPTIPGELFAAFVLTTVAQGNIVKINPTEALGMKGVVAFFGAQDIPGLNSFTSPMLIGLDEPEEIFCSGEVRYAGQPLGIIVAETQLVAQKAAKLVTVEYENVKKPVLTIRDALNSGDASRMLEKGKIEPSDPSAKALSKHTIKGSFEIGGQYHYTMETQTCLCVPLEDGMDVYPSCQWMDLTQIAISQALAVSENSININVRRLGGAYGAKISRATHVASACAVAAHALNRPVRFILSIEDNMKSMGKRFACACDYEVGVDDDGVIKYMDTTIYENSGFCFNESVSALTIHHFTNCYDSSTWAVKGVAVRTDLPSNTYCRAPGTTEGIAFIENIMEHIGKVLNKDPVQVRLNNMKKENNPLPQLISDLKKSSDYEERILTVEEYNKENRWKKRGIAIVPMNYPFPFWGNFHAMVSIYGADGTVAVTHGGIECGQGLNTKVLQVCAYTLKIPLEAVSVKPSNNFIAPNGMVTGGSIASEACAYATMMCCKELLKRLEPLKEKLKNPTWKELVAEAYKESVNLSASYMFTAKDDVKPYNIWGVTIAEIEVDILTGQQQILRVDLLEDVGVSLSPEVDVGQVEGAFVMGLGYWLMELLVYNPDNGELLTNRTWTYKPPGAKDIPIDFRTYFRRNSTNPTGVLRSKATGEPSLCMSSVIFFALRNALDSARIDAGHPEKWYNMDAPGTAENIFLTAQTRDEQFTL